MLRKKFCLSIPEACTSTVTTGTLATIAYKVFGEEGHDIFVADLFEAGNLVGRYFADKATGEHKGWNAKTGVWRQKIRLDNLAADITGDVMAGEWCYYISDRYMFAENTNDVAYDYFGQSVGSWENDLERKIVVKRRRRHEEIVDERVQKILPPEPEGFLAWASEKIKVSYALCEKSEEKKEVRCTCTCCGASWIREKFYKSGLEIECPECGETIRTKRLKGTNNVFGTSMGAYTVSPARDGGSWILMQYDVLGTFRGGKWDFEASPRMFADIPKGHDWGRLYYKDGGWNDKKPPWGMFFSNGLLYKDFGGADELMPEDTARKLHAVAAAELQCNVDRVIILDMPEIEYLIKGRFYRLAKESLDGYYENTKKGAKTLEEYLKLDGQRTNRLRQMNGGRCELSWLQWERKTGKKIADADIGYFARKGVYSSGKTRYGSGWAEIFKRLGSPIKAKNYVERQAKESGMSAAEIVSDYDDYIRMAKQQKLNLDSEIFYKPKNLASAHAECVAFGQKKAAASRAKEIRGKFPKVEKILGEIKEKYEYKSGEYQIMVPSCIEDIISEGRSLGHCIDTSDRYFDRIEKRETYLVFLRHSSAPMAPYYTFEIEPGGTIRQQRTTGNRQNKTQVKAYRSFVMEWQNEVQKRITEEDRKLAERSNRLRIDEYRKLREDKELIHGGVLAGKLLVDILEADLIVAG